MNLNRCDDPLIPPLLSSAGWHLCIRLKGLWQNRQYLYPENAQTQTRKHTQVHSMHRVNICHMFGLTVVSAWHLFCRYVEQTGALWWITHDIKTTSSVDVYWCGNIQDRGFFFFFFSSWSSWLIHEPHHLLFDLTQLCLWNLFQTSCIKIKAAWSPWGSSKLYNGGMRFSLRANDTPQTLLQMHETDEKKREKIQPTAKTNTAFLDINSWSFFISSVISAGCFARGQGGIPWHLEPTFPWLPLHASSRSYSSSGCVRDEPVSLMLK